MRTYKEVLEDGIQLLETAAIEEARLDAWLLLEYTADITRAWYYAHMDDGLDAKTEERYRTLCTKRAQHIPLQHITGRAYFMGYEFCVDERVLGPGQDTEVLVEEAVKYLQEQEECRVVDLCSGSGCIGLALASQVSRVRVVLGEYSDAALKICRQNIRRNGLSARVVPVQADARERPGRTLGEFQCIISNPPYIPRGDIAGLDASVRD